MQELEKAFKLSVSGKLRAEILSAFDAYIKAWELVMPPAERLVLDFGLKDFYKTGLIECWIANETVNGYCGKFLFVFNNQTCPAHRHAEKHETFYIVKGRVQMTYNGTTFEMKAGDCLSVEVGKIHSFTGLGPALLLEISKPCLIQDNFFTNPDIRIIE